MANIHTSYVDPDDSDNRDYWFRYTNHGEGQAQFDVGDKMMGKGGPLDGEKDSVIAAFAVYMMKSQIDKIAQQTFETEDGYKAAHMYAVFFGSDALAGEDEEIDDNE